MYRKIVFHLLCCIIVIVSSIDIYWLSKNRHFHIDSYVAEQAGINKEHTSSGDYVITEQNPIGRYLLELDGGDVSLFILLKMIGTYIVVAILYTFRHYNIRYTYVVAASVATAQLILLIYLYSHPDQSLFKYVIIFQKLESIINTGACHARLYI